MSEVIYELPDGREWIVRAYEYPTLEEARAAWSLLEIASAGRQQEISLWATTTPAGEPNLLVMCGEREYLPDVVDAPLYLLTPDEAQPFILRRARMGLDGLELLPEGEHYETRTRYGMENPQVINEEGGVDPWQKS